MERAAKNAIQIEAFGNAAEVAKAVDIPDVGSPATREMVIAVKASPCQSIQRHAAVGVLAPPAKNKRHDPI